ncbi:MAG: hemin uptake protein HemP [Proteobacteria bacterium]|nr:hemin uptake protein HemP [Pseudomonadota bacterium]
MTPVDPPAMTPGRSARPGGASTTLRRLRVRDLLHDAREVILEHEREEYRLRITSKGKLILTK